MAKLEEAYPSGPTRGQLSRVKWYRRLWLWLAFSIGVPLIFGIYAALRFLPDHTAHYASPEEHFKYGSTGGERTVGFPLKIWQALPQVCREYLPAAMPAPEATPYAAFGMVYEANKELPIGVSKRRHLGIDRVFLIAAHVIPAPCAIRRKASPGSTPACRRTHWTCWRSKHFSLIAAPTRSSVPNISFRKSID